jgi:hypothetical protein
MSAYFTPPAPEDSPASVQIRDQERRERLKEEKSNPKDNKPSLIGNMIGAGFFTLLIAGGTYLLGGGLISFFGLGIGGLWMFLAVAGYLKDKDDAH